MRVRGARRSEHPNVAVAKHLWLATAEGDAGALRELLAPDVEWRVYGEHPLAGRFRSQAAVIDQLSRFGDAVDDARLEVRDILTSARGALIRYRLSASRSGRSLETDYHLLLEIEDGKVVRGQVVPTDAAAVGAFFSWMH